MLVHCVTRRTTAATLLVGTLILGSCAFVERANETVDGTQGNNSAVASSASDDGRYVAFASTASNLVAGDTNGTTDVFVKDLRTGAIERVSVASDGTQGNSVSYQPAISGDGRWVAFTSLATNLVTSDANPLFDVFLHDRQTGDTTLVSVDENGEQFSLSVDQPDVNDNGALVVFRVDWPPASQIFAYSRLNGYSQLVSRGVDATFNSVLGPADSENPSISANGSLIAFESKSRFNYFSQPTTSSTSSIAVVREVDLGDLFGGYAGPMALTMTGPDGPSTDPDIEGTVGSEGWSWTGTLVFESVVDNLVATDANGSTKDVFALTMFGNLQTASISLVSQTDGGAPADGPSATATVSEDGRWVAYRTLATNLVSGDTNGETDVLVHDRFEDRTLRVSVGPLGNQANDRSYSPAITGDGRYVAFTTDATNVATQDTNNRADVVMRHVLTPTATSVVPSVLAPGSVTTVTVSGTEYDEGALLLKSDGPFTFGTPSVDPSGTMFTVVVTVPAGAAAGAYDLQVLLAGTGPGPTNGALDFCFDCLTIP